MFEQTNDPFWVCLILCILSFMTGWSIRGFWMDLWDLRTKK